MFLVINHICELALVTVSVSCVWDGEVLVELEELIKGFAPVQNSSPRPVQPWAPNCVNCCIVIYWITRRIIGISPGLPRAPSTNPCVLHSQKRGPRIRRIRRKGRLCALFFSVAPGAEWKDTHWKKKTEQMPRQVCWGPRGLFIESIVWGITGRHGLLNLKAQDTFCIADTFNGVQV